MRKIICQGLPRTAASGTSSRDRLSCGHALRVGLRVCSGDHVSRRVVGLLRGFQDGWLASSLTFSSILVNSPLNPSFLTISW